MVRCLICDTTIYNELFMKKALTLTALLTAALMVSCNGQINPDVPVSSYEELVTIDEQTAMRNFAAILSKAVSSDKELRVFLKQEALKEFDRDFDVFYPYVKNEVVHDGMTFRELLLNFSETPSNLELIERSLPKLTILVPDFSWIDPRCFSVKKWDTSIEEVGVGYADQNASHPVFCNGEIKGELPLGAFPDFPVLIVKSNERMIVKTPATRASEARYDFIAPEFDGSKIEQTRGWTDYVNDNPDTSSVDWVRRDGDFISETDLRSISPETLQAYDEFGTGWGDGVQRDFIYYGMTKSNVNNGIYCKHKKELLYRFSFVSRTELWYNADSSEDPDLDGTIKTGRDETLDFDEFLSELWSTGKYEVKFDFVKANKDGTTSSLGSPSLTIDAGDLMYISKVYVIFGWTFFGNKNWHEYRIKEEYIEPKWYYPSDKGNMILINTPWDLSSGSCDIWISAKEIDEASTTVTTQVLQS